MTMRYTLVHQMQATCKLIMMAFGLCSTYYLFYGDAVYPRAPDAGNLQINNDGIWSLFYLLFIL